MTVAISHAAARVPAAAAQSSLSQGYDTARDDAPPLGGLAGAAGQALAESWVPFCPDLMNEVASGIGRRDG